MSDKDCDSGDVGWTNARTELRSRLADVWQRKAVPAWENVEAALTSSIEPGENPRKRIARFRDKSFSEIDLSEPLFDEHWLFRFPDEIAAYYLGSVLWRVTGFTNLTGVWNTDYSWFLATSLLKEKRLDFRFWKHFTAEEATLVADCLEAITKYSDPPIEAEINDIGQELKRWVARDEPIAGIGE